MNNNFKIIERSYKQLLIVLCVYVISAVARLRYYYYDGGRTVGANIFNDSRYTLSILIIFMIHLTFIAPAIEEFIYRFWLINQSSPRLIWFKNLSLFTFVYLLINQIIRFSNNELHNSIINIIYYNINRLTSLGTNSEYLTIIVVTFIIPSLLFTLLNQIFSKLSYLLIILSTYIEMYKIPSILLSTFIFTIVHTSYNNFVNLYTPALITLIPVFCVGFALAICRRVFTFRTNIFLHSIHNSFVTLSFAFYSSQSFGKVLAVFSFIWILIAIYLIRREYLKLKVLYNT
jgi:hypothetical protein